MEEEEKLYEKLGEENVNLLLKETDNGKVDEDKVKAMALLMGAHGVFKEQLKNKKPLRVVLMAVLDEWHRESLHKTDDGFFKLMDILRDDKVKLKHLASEMKRPCSPIPMTCSTFGGTWDGTTDDTVNSPFLKDENIPSTGRDNIMIRNWRTILIGIGMLGIGILIGRFIPRTQDCVSVKEQHDSTNQETEESTKIVVEETETNKANMTTRTVIVQRGSPVVLHSCPIPQYKIPDLPAKLEKVVGAYAEPLGLLVCGGLVKNEGPDDNTRPDHPKLCFVHKICSCGWKESYKLNTNRVESLMTVNGNKIIILSGRSSQDRSLCYQSQEVLDLDNPDDGWREEPSVGKCLAWRGQHSIIEVPCTTQCMFTCHPL